MANDREGDLLHVDRLSKLFSIRQGLARIRLMAVNQASFSLRRDVPEILTLAGESGSGKTTLARMILGLIKPTDGHIRFLDRDVTSLGRRDKRAFRKAVQPVFQDPYATFSPLKRVETYLYETVHNYGIAPKADASRYVDGALQMV